MEDSAGIISSVLSAPETYAVVLKSSGELVGCAGFNAGEAARAAVEHGFNDLGLSGVHSGYYDGNDRSRNVLEKLGFEYVRTVYDTPCALLGETRTEHLLFLPAGK